MGVNMGHSWQRNGDITAVFQFSVISSQCFSLPFVSKLQYIPSKQETVMILIVNDKRHDVDVSPETPLLWVIRDTLGLTGTKFGCGIAQCGACTVHVDGTPIRSCITAVSGVAGKKITTIEGLSPNASHALQLAWIAEQVPQCGYCQSGQLMSAAALLAKNPKPTDQDIDNAMSGNICRCGTYQRIRRAIHRAARV
jgi:isoquinoline 1-oxidoreductase alpha subunit